MCNILGNEIISQINKNKTVLKQLNAIKDYIKKYPQTREFFAKQSYSTNATRIAISNIYIPTELSICEGDIIIDTQFKVFRVTGTTATQIYVSYYNTITGEKGETPLIYTDFIYDEEYGGITGDEPFYIDNNKFNRTPKINDTFYMFVYASKEFNSVVIQVFTVLEVDTSRTKVQVINAVQIPQQYNIKGEWVENNRYNVNDWVTYGNGIYLCIKNIANSTTIPPLDKTNFEFIGGEKSKTIYIEKIFVGEDTQYVDLHNAKYIELNINIAPTEKITNFGSDIYFDFIYGDNEKTDFFEFLVNTPTQEFAFNNIIISTMSNIIINFACIQDNTTNVIYMSRCLNITNEVLFKKLKFAYEDAEGTYKMNGSIKEYFE